MFPVILIPRFFDLIYISRSFNRFLSSINFYEYFIILFFSLPFPFNTNLLSAVSNLAFSHTFSDFFYVSNSTRIKSLFLVFLLECCCIVFLSACICIMLYFLSLYSEIKSVDFFFNTSIEHKRPL